MAVENKQDVLASQENKMPPYKKGFYLEGAYCRKCNWKIEMNYEDALLDSLEYDVWVTAKNLHDKCKTLGCESDLRVLVGSLLYE